MLSIVLAALLLVAPGFDQRPEDLAVRVANPGHGYGTAFWVGDEGLLLTAAHVVGTSEELLLDLPSGQVTAQVVYRSEETDVAVLRAGLLVDGLAVNCELPYQGQAVRGVGYPAGLPHTLVFGAVAGLETSGPTGNQVMLDLTVSAGMSGGPILNDDSEAIGIIVSRLTYNWHPTGFTMMETGPAMCAALAKASKP